jgi:hypothetical protein
MKKLLLLLLACAGVMIAGYGQENLPRFTKEDMIRLINENPKLAKESGMFHPTRPSLKKDTVWLYPITDEFQHRMWYAGLCKIPLTDWHIHIRGGMTTEKAGMRSMYSDIKSAVLENFGRDWPISNNIALAKFILESKSPAVLSTSSISSTYLSRSPVGLQVNDRDWYKQIDPRLYEHLDFILADTMIMGVTADGKPRKLWLPDVKIDDADAWMEEYMAHNLRILDEPVSILANPTYLPPCISNQYERLWTEDRMRKVIAKAIENDVALEIQAESPYPKPAFIKLAKQMGAKFCFGTNNTDDKVKDLSTWFNAIEQLDLRPSDMATIKRRPLP